VQVVIHHQRREVFAVRQPDALIRSTQFIDIRRVKSNVIIF
jgi:hypothetical protein